MFLTGGLDWGSVVGGGRALGRSVMQLGLGFRVDAVTHKLAECNLSYVCVCFTAYRPTMCTLRPSFSLVWSSLTCNLQLLHPPLPPPRTSTTLELPTRSILPPQPAPQPPPPHMSIIPTLPPLLPRATWLPGTATQSSSL